MNHSKRTEYVTRDSILKMLSDVENARMCMAETALGLSDGDEYLDLEHIARGVRRAGGTVSPMGAVLPRKAVNADTWNRILAQLAGPRA